MQHILVRLAFIMGCFLALPNQALAHVCEGKEEHHKVSVNGEANISIAPDKATLRFAMKTLADTPKEAREENAKTTKEVLKAVKKIVSNDKQIKMDTLRIDEKFEYDHKKQKSLLIGFEAYREFTVELYELEKLPEMVEAVVDNGSNRLLGVDYGLQDENAVRMEILAAAVNDAKTKAELMLNALGVKLGPVINIQEQYFEKPRPVMLRTMALAMADGGESSETVAEGEIRFKVSVHVDFAIEQ